MKKSLDEIKRGDVVVVGDELVEFVVRSGPATIIGRSLTDGELHEYDGIDDELDLADDGGEDKVPDLPKNTRIEWVSVKDDEMRMGYAQPDGISRRRDGFVSTPWSEVEHYVVLSSDSDLVLSLVAAVRGMFS